MATDRRAKAGSILLAGALSILFAEVLSGSSVLWFVTPWGWAVTFWLYLAHTVLFVNLALRYRRTSMTSLYLWGVLFGLYESWITKVTWAGYAGQSPGWGTVLGFSFPELLIIVFFWHPVFSWILPVLSFEALGGGTGVLPNHRRWLTRSKRNVGFVFGLAVSGAAFLAWNAHGNAVAVLVTMAGSLGLVWAFARLATSGGHTLTLESLRLGRRGMRVLVGYLALLYGLSFVLILPERIAPPLTIALTLGLYAVVLLLLRRAGTDPPAGDVELDAGPLFTPQDLARAAMALTVLAALFALALPLAYPVVVIGYLGFVIAGPMLFLWAAIRVVRGADFA